MAKSECCWPASHPLEFVACVLSVRELHEHFEPRWDMWTIPHFEVTEFDELCDSFIAITGATSLDCCVWCHRSCVHFRRVRIVSHQWMTFLIIVTDLSSTALFSGNSVGYKLGHASFLWHPNIVAYLYLKMRNTMVTSPFYRLDGRQQFDVTRLFITHDPLYSYVVLCYSMFRDQDYQFSLVVGSRAYEAWLFGCISCVVCYKRLVCSCKVLLVLMYIEISSRLMETMDNFRAYLGSLHCCFILIMACATNVSLQLVSNPYAVPTVVRITIFKKRMLRICVSICSCMPSELATTCAWTFRQTVRKLEKQSEWSHLRCDVNNANSQQN